MPWIYLLVSLIVVALTYNVYRPRRRGARLAFASFFAGWLWGELVPHAIALVALATFAFAWAGALEAWPGVLGLLLCAGACGFLMWHYQRGLDRRQRLERDLEEGLGANFAARVRPELRAKWQTELPWRRLLRIFPIRCEEVECCSDIRFDRVRGINLKLDVYRHRSHPSNAPTLLQVHGGGWSIGDKREQALPLMHQLAAHGWVCVSANYRLSPHATFPEHLIDVKKAIAWIREHAAEYGADPEFLVVTGGSAGGHLAALAALTANDPEYQPGFEKIDTSVRAAIPFYGVYDFTDRWGLWPNRGLARILERDIIKGSREELPEEYRKASPFDRIHDHAPSFCVLHGSSDTLVPVEEARRFSRELRNRSSAPVVYVELEHVQHAFELLPSVNTQTAVDIAERFATAVYSRYLDERDAEPQRKPKSKPKSHSERKRAPAKSAG